MRKKVCHEHTFHVEIRTWMWLRVSVYCEIQMAVTSDAIFVFDSAFDDGNGSGSVSVSNGHLP